MTKKWLITVVTLTIMLLLAACNNPDNEQANEAQGSDDKPAQTEDNKVDLSTLPFK